MITGDGLSKVLLLSENLAEQNHFTLERLLKRSGVSRAQFYFGTMDPGWFSQAKQLGVKVVVPLGEYPLRAATQQSDIKRWRGRVYLHPEFDWLTLPTFKPSRLRAMKQPKIGKRDLDIMRAAARYQGRWRRDIHYALHIAREGFVRTPVKYLLDPPAGLFREWAESFLEILRAESALKLSFDIETPYKKKKQDEGELEESEQLTDLNTQILRVGFSHREHEAVTVPWTGPYLPAIRLLLESSAPKVVWNGIAFDIPVVKRQGMEVAGTIYDGMDAMKFWQSDLDRGLEAVSADATDVLPWKHLSDAMPEWYNAADADVALRITNFLHQQIREQGAWDVYLETFVEVMDHMTAAGERGVSIDLGYQAELKTEFATEIARLNTIIQEVVPDQFRPRTRYKRKPEGLHQVPLDTGGVLWFGPNERRFESVEVDGQAKFCSNCGLQVSNKTEHLKGGKKKNPCAAASAVLTKGPAVLVEWDEILPFNSSSSNQLIAYMKAHRHPVGTNKDDPDGESADRQHLESLAKNPRIGPKHPVYGLAAEKSKVDKAESTYLWVPDVNGRIHQTYVNTPFTLRFGGRAHNLMNVGKRETNPWAVKARNQIIADPGYVFVQADSSSIEAVMQGWYMGDEHYMWLANQSIHAWLATKKLGWDFNPDTVERVKKDHKKLYDGMKVMNYTINFGGSAFGAHKANPDLFPTIESAYTVETQIFELIPTLENYQYGVRYRAHKQGYLQTPWNVRLYFYDVYTYKRDRFGNVEHTSTGKPRLKLSKDGKRVVAAEPQHSNAMFARQNLNQIGRSKWGEYMPANVFVHDGYNLHVPRAMAEEAGEFLLTLLTRPIPEMGNLKVGAALEIGTNWGDYHRAHNPNGMKGQQKIVIEKQQLTWMPSSAVVPAELVTAA